MDNGDHPVTTQLLVPLDQGLVIKSENVLSQALEERDLYFHFETKESCKDLLGLCPKNLQNLESLTLEVFMEDDDMDMRLLSCRDISNDDPVGYIMWRNIPTDEIHEWVKLFNSPSPRDKIGALSHKKQLPRHMLSSGHKKNENGDDDSMSHLSPLLLTEEGWIKIELMCVSSKRTGSKIGSLLLSAALAFATLKENKTHALLQVAGGRQNVPAMKLYEKLHFVDGKEDFNSPNENLLVLWDIREALKSLKWEDFCLHPLVPHSGAGMLTA